MGDLKELKRVVMKMHTESINILTEKRAALEAGDDAMVRAMGEGKDIMSIMCEHAEAAPVGAALRGANKGATAQCARTLLRRRRSV